MRRRQAERCWLTVSPQLSPALSPLSPAFSCLPLLCACSFWPAIRLAGKHWKRFDSVAKNQLAKQRILKLGRGIFYKVKTGAQLA